MATSSRRRPTTEATAGPGARPDRSSGETPAPEAAETTSSTAPPGWRIETWSIARLKDHDQQAALFHDLEGVEFADLVDSIRREGLKEPVEVAPDGTKIDGHQRVRAALHLGWTQIRVKVRDDLAGDKAAVDRAHIEANRTRRQLGALDQARLEKRSLEPELGRPIAASSPEENQRLQDRLCERYGRSGRHARRLINILRCPMPIQKAVGEGRLPMVPADKVSRLSRSAQAEIAMEIEAGGDPAEIVVPYLTTRGRPQPPEDPFARLMVELERGLDSLEGREAGVRRPGYRIDEDLRVLERFGRFREAVAPILERQLEGSRRLDEQLAREFNFEDRTDDVEPELA
jgi:hypothetical protein